MRRSILSDIRMTGRLLIKSFDDELNEHDHLIFGLDDGQELRFNNVHKLGRVYLVGDEAEVVGRLGPEPLDDDFTLAAFVALLSARRGKIKPLLLNQRFIAGIGNIYADEAIFTYSGTRPKLAPAADAHRAHGGGRTGDVLLP
jgi:formamidopyrimidine-DNA glycosylase